MERSVLYVVVLLLIPTRIHSFVVEVSRRFTVVPEASGIDEYKLENQNLGLASPSYAFLHLLPPENLDKNIYSSEIPQVSAWQLLTAEFRQHVDFESKFEVANQNSKVPRLPKFFDFLINGEEIDEYHEKNVTTIIRLWDQVKKYSNFSDIEDSVLSKINLSLRIAYVGMWGKTYQNSTVDSINRAKGIAEILTQLTTWKGNDTSIYVETIVATVLHNLIYEYVTSNSNKLEGEIIRCKLENMFGRGAITLAEEYNRLPTFRPKAFEYTMEQSEFFQEMLVVKTEEIRTLFIRLADRIHNLRVLKSLPIQDIERRKIANETRHVYIPLAHKMNLPKALKMEMEDISFSILEPSAFQECKMTRQLATKVFAVSDLQIYQRLYLNILKLPSEHIQDAHKDIQSMVSNNEFIKAHKIEVNIDYRIKSTYQMYQKQKIKGLNSSSQVRDAVGFRIILNSPRRAGETDADYTERSQNACYEIIKQIQNLQRWNPVGKCKDYFKEIVKDNGYQSLHQYIRHKEYKLFVEVQVRTRQMHVNAELGNAAHWYYKDTRYRPELAESYWYKIAWRSENQKQSKSFAEFLKLAKEQILNKRVLVYSEDQTTLLNLKRGASALDGAFALHTKIGLSTKEVYVNGKRVGLDYVLQMGDVIKVVTTPDKSPAAVTQWLKYLQSYNAADSLKRHLNRNTKSMNAALGCLRLLLTFKLSSEVIALKFSDVNKYYPCAADLLTLFQKNSVPGTFSEFIISLGDTYSNEIVGSKIGRLLGIDPSILTISSKQLSLLWAKSQESHGWEDKVMRNNVLLPLLNDILPNYSGLKLVKEKWIELVGPKSLTDEQSQYFSALSRHRNKSMVREQANVSVDPDAQGTSNTHRFTTETISSDLKSAETVTIPSINTIEAIAAESTEPEQVLEYQRNIDSRVEKIPTEILLSSNLQLAPTQGPVRYPFRTKHPSIAPVVVPKVYRKSVYVVAGSPYSLEAAVMPSPLRRLAQQNYAERALFNEKKADRSQYFGTNYNLRQIVVTRQVDSAK